MFAPGIVGVTVGLLILLTVRDSPEKIGYPPIEIVAAKAKKDVSSLLYMLLKNLSGRACGKRPL